MVKNKLKVEFSFEFILIGIISVVKEYKLAWKLNNALGIKLIKEPDLKIEFYNQGDIVVSNYLFETENSSIRLIRNKSFNTRGGASSFLLPELNSFDFLIMVTGFEDTFTIEDIKKKIQGISEVQFHKVFDPNELKSRENLIF